MRRQVKVLGRQAATVVIFGFAWKPTEDDLDS
jgi:hypothetical protein